MKLLKKTARSVLSSGIAYKALRTIALRQNSTTILCYHTLGPDHDCIDAWTVLEETEFLEQIDFLRKNYDIVSLDDALSSWGQCQRPQVVLTFDDGDVGLFKHLLPIVESECLPVTIYIATGQIESGQPYWFDQVMNVLQRPGKTVIDLTHHNLQRWCVGPSVGPDRWAVISNILETFKTVPSPQREILVKELIQQAGPQISNFSSLAPLSITQLQKLAANPLVSIGAHSHCHNLLDQIPLNQARESIKKSRILLEAWTGQEIRHFAYPNGNYNAALQKELTEQKFNSATILDMAITSPSNNWMALSRVGIGRYDVDARFRLKLLSTPVLAIK